MKPLVQLIYILWQKNEGKCNYCPMEYSDWPAWISWSALELRWLESTKYMLTQRYSEKKLVCILTQGIITQQKGVCCTKERHGLYGALKQVCKHSLCYCLRVTLGKMKWDGGGTVVKKCPYPLVLTLGSNLGRLSAWMLPPSPASTTQPRAPSLSQREQDPSLPHTVHAMQHDLNNPSAIS
jgi:hypothetical protein